MNKYLLLGLAAILIIAGGWWYFSRSNAPATSEAVDLTLEQTTQPNTNTQTQPVTNNQPSQQTQTTQNSSVSFNRSNIKIGDHVGGFTVTDIKPISGTILNRQDPEGNMEVVFTGSVELKGTFSRKSPVETYAVLTLTSDSKTKLPFDSSWGAPNVVLIETAKNIPSIIGEGDTVIVTTGRYNYRMFPSETYSTIMALSAHK
jgi:hypothetical protein